MKRLNFSKSATGSFYSHGCIEYHVIKTSIDPLHQELVRIRASQINGCAYCVDKHSRDARKAGASEQKVFLISAWREAGNIFAEEERELLPMTEEISLIHQHGLSDEVYEQAVNLFGEKKTAEIIMIIVTINAWNRIGVARHLKPASLKNEAVSA